MKLPTKDEIQSLIRKGIPYSLTIPAAPKAVDEMSHADFNAIMETGLAQAQKGESLPADEVFDELLN